MKTLLTFVGFHDPYSPGLVEGQEQPGPILSLLAERSFERVILFDTPQTPERTKATVEAARARFPNLRVDVRFAALDDPTDYVAILARLRHHVHEICSEDPKPEYWISVTSGTPHMHAIWFLLAAGGEIPARILNIRPPKFVTRDRPPVTEVDFTRPEFPLVRVKPEWAADFVRDGGADLPPDAAEAIAQLGLIGDHPRMRRALETAAALAPSEASVILLGETGTGKELVARLIHYLSGRPRGRFVPVNCGAIPKELAESLLFGHKRGAFTGALNDQAGKFDIAHGGTLFLDEVGELPPSTQAKLLRVLQDGQVEPVGAPESHEVDVRVVAATNRDLADAVRKREFRDDLYYRLAVGVIELPPLRERASDIPKLALHILDGLNKTVRRPKRLSVAALQKLQAHPWPGNVRALANAIERSALLCRADVLDAADLQIDDRISSADPLEALPTPCEGFSLEEFLGTARKRMMMRALDLAGGKQSGAARLLGVTPQAVSKFLKAGD